MAINGLSVRLRHLQFLKHFRVVVNDTGEVHHLSQKFDLGHFQEGFQILQGQLAPLVSNGVAGTQEGAEK
jgi:hypothetical protein